MQITSNPRGLLVRNNYCGYRMGVVISALTDAGEAARGVSRYASAKPGEGHRSIVTEADEFSQETIILRCSEIDGAKFLCEEDSGDPRVLDKNNPAGAISGITFVVDPLDGTSRFAGSFPDWSVGIGTMKDGDIVESGIAAPEANGGFLLFSEKGRGAALLKNGIYHAIDPLSAETPIRDSVVLFGVDASLYHSATCLFPAVAANVRAKYDVGSGLFGLMMVALGNAQAVVQTPQKAWDWVPAYRAIVETGRVFHFFRLDDGNLVPVERYDFAALCYKPKENRLGFVAGEPTIAQKLFDKLPRSGWERISPDTFTASW